MPAPKPTQSDLERAYVRYDAGDRPWRQTLNRVDWFIANGDKLYPLKYTYSLATDIAPPDYTTDQMKHALADLHLAYVSLKSQRQNDADFHDAVRNSLASRDGRAKRLGESNPTPNVTYSIVASYARNPDVVAEVLERANGVCECCKNAAPFIRASDGTPYLEVHHIDFLANGGEDTVTNAEALCPNCHREKHYG